MPVVVCVIGKKKSGKTTTTVGLVGVGASVVGFFMVENTLGSPEAPAENKQSALDAFPFSVGQSAFGAAVEVEAL